MGTRLDMLALYEVWLEEDKKFTDGNKAAGTRARKALSEIKKLCDRRRKEIQEIKNKT